MAFDAYYLKFVLDEVRAQILGARVEKIHQPSRDTVILLLRCEGGRKKLLFAANPAAPRLHLTAASPENPPEPPMFCMLLRKHLSGARLAAVTQPPLERAAEFVFACTDELGFPVQKKLVVELMGRTCNLYLLGPDGRILDCLRRVGLDESARRQALPGLYYQPPTPVTKRDPMGMQAADFAGLLAAPGADVLSARLMDTLGGLSPLVCREAALFAAGDVDARISGGDLAEIAQKLAEFFGSALSAPAPWYVSDGGCIRQFAFCPVREYGDCARAESFSALLDAFYTVRDRADAIRQKSQSVRKTVSNLCQRLTRKISVQETELAATRDRERLRQLGDIVTANLSRIARGQAALEAEDFYDEAMPRIVIPLAPQLSPQQNAAKFYKDYARMKNAEKELTRQLALARQELAYLESVLEELARADTEQAVEEIRQELHLGGYLRAETGKKRIRQAKLPPLAFRSPDGYPILVGRNNRQNDELTLRQAHKNDLWLHVQKLPGSHVILACGGNTPSDEAVTLAARLAAAHSQARMGQNVAVDVTAVKNIKKPAGAKPGMVVYETYRTVYVDPLPEDGLPADAGG